MRIIAIALMMAAACEAQYVPPSGGGGGAPTGNAGGDLSGTYPNPNVAKVNGATLGTASAKNTGTSGNTVPLLDGANTWTTTQAIGTAVVGGMLKTTVTYSATPTFTVTASTALQYFTITLTGNVTSSTLTATAATSAQDIAFEICQDGSGGHTFVWPANVAGSATIDTTASACTRQAFRWTGSAANAISSAISDASGIKLLTSTGTITFPAAPATLQPALTGLSSTDIPAATGVAGVGLFAPSGIKCDTSSALWLCTAYNPTASTGLTQFNIRAGAAQSTNPLIGFMTNLNVIGGSVGTANTVFNTHALTGFDYYSAAGSAYVVANGQIAYFGVGSYSTGFYLSTSGFHSTTSRSVCFDTSGVCRGAFAFDSVGFIQLNAGTTPADNTINATGQWAGLKLGTLSLQTIANPGTPTITNIGSAGGTSYGYKVACYSRDGGPTAASAEGTTATGNATLTSSNKNRVTFTISTGAAYCNVYRTTGGATQGKINTSDVTSSPFDDTGLAASGTAPVTNNTGTIISAGITPAASSQVCQASSMWADDSFVYHCNAAGTTISRATLSTW